jgi:hypothetical protein
LLSYVDYVSLSEGATSADNGEVVGGVYALAILVSIISAVFHLAGPWEAVHFLGIEHVSTILADWQLWKF